MHRSLLRFAPALLFGCALPMGDAADDTAAVDTAAVDTADDTAADTVPRDPCDPDAVFTGAVDGSQWAGTQVSLSFFEPGTGAWSDGCYGGYIEDTLTLDGTAFDWSARVYASAGSDPRPVRAVGCVTDGSMELSIVEVDGTPWHGPWRLARIAGEVPIKMCD